MRIGTDAMTTAQRIPPRCRQPSSPFDTVQLVGGPFNGARFRVRRSIQAGLTLRVSQDRCSPATFYKGNSATGRLLYVDTYDEGTP